MFDSRIFNTGSDAIPRRKSVPKRDTRYEGRPEGDLIHANSLFKLRESAAKKAAEKKYESPVVERLTLYNGLQKPKPAPISDSLVGKMMRVGDMPVGTRCAGIDGNAYIIHGGRVNGGSNLILIRSALDDILCAFGLFAESARKVLADPVVEVGDLVDMRKHPEGARIVTFIGAHPDGYTIHCSEVIFHKDNVQIIEKGVKKELKK